MKEITLEELLEAGCHFGHQVTRQNPKSRDFVFEARDNIHIIDLAKTKEGLEMGAEYIKDVAAHGGTLLVVATKRQAKSIIEEEMKRISQGSPIDTSSASDRVEEPQSSLSKMGIFFVTSRWIGGTLTNFFEISKNYKKLRDLETRLKDEEEKAKYTKKEIGQWAKTLVKLHGFYGGVYEMKKVPTVLFIVDTHFEELAVFEAQRMGIKRVGIVDTNADPTIIDYPIPANDDAIGSIKLITSYILDAWVEGKEEQRLKIKDSVEDEARHRRQNEEAKVEKIEDKEVVKEKATKVKKEKPEVKEEKSGKRKPGTSKKTS